MKRCKRWFKLFFGLVVIALLSQAILFQQESSQNPWFVIMACLLLVASIGSAYWWIKSGDKDLITFPRFVFMIVIYSIFFTAISIQTPHTDFLLDVREKIQAELDKPFQISKGI